MRLPRFLSLLLSVPIGPKAVRLSVLVLLFAGTLFLLTDFVRNRLLHRYASAAKAGPAKRHAESFSPTPNDVERAHASDGADRRSYRRNDPGAGPQGEARGRAGGSTADEANAVPASTFSPSASTAGTLPGRNVTSDGVLPPPQIAAVQPPPGGSGGTAGQPPGGADLPLAATTVLEERAATPERVLAVLAWNASQEEGFSKVAALLRDATEASVLKVIVLQKLKSLPADRWVPLLGDFLSLPATTGSAYSKATASALLLRAGTEEARVLADRLAESAVDPWVRRTIANLRGRPLPGD